MLLGVLLPAAMLIGYELYAMYKGKTSVEYIQFKSNRIRRKEQALEVTEEEAFEIRKQNKFGLKVISFALFFISALLYILSGITAKGGGVVAGISTIILICAFIPYLKARRTATA
jgi:VIT1/CCC1 family predicted Fe2+/Mn2+ transporter